MIKHKKEKPNPKRSKLLKEGKRFYKTDGLSDLK